MKPATLLAALAVLAVLLVTDVTAQQGQHRGPGSGGRAMRDGDRDAKKGDAPRATGQDPFGALERELPSLKVDLLIRAEQLEDWRVVERDVRDVAEMERARKRHLLALKDAAEKAPTAVAFIASIAEDDRLQAEASAELKRHFEALYAKLDDNQRRTLDRRAVQSQTEPLGR